MSLSAPLSPFCSWSYRPFYPFAVIWVGLEVGEEVNACIYCFRLNQKSGLYSFCSASVCWAPTMSPALNPGLTLPLSLRELKVRNRILRSCPFPEQILCTHTPQTQNRTHCGLAHFLLVSILSQTVGSLGAELWLILIRIPSTQHSISHTEQNDCMLREKWEMDEIQACRVDWTHGRMNFEWQILSTILATVFCADVERAAVHCDVVAGWGLTDHFTGEKTEVWGGYETHHVTQGVRSKVWNVTQVLGLSVTCSLCFAH